MARGEKGLYKRYNKNLKMKKITKRFKRALAGFLKDELKEYQIDPPFFSSPIKEVPFSPNTVFLSQEIAVNEYRRYEYDLERAKSIFAKQIIENHIIVEADEMVSPNSMFNRRITLSLTIMKK